MIVHGRRIRTLVVAALAMFTLGATGRSDADSKGARPPSSVFHIAKSENKNQVHYGVHLDDACRPLAKTPVYGYWRELEQGPSATSPILKHEQPAYGLTRPRRIQHVEQGGLVEIGLRGFPDRPVRIETFRNGTQCVARAVTTIKGQPAILQSIYVELGFLFSIKHVIVRGISLSTGQPLEEKVNG